MDNFTQINFKINNLDLYYVRTSILNALNKTLPMLNGKLLDIGCGKMPYKAHILDNSKVENYCGLDIDGAIEYDSQVKPDFTWDGTIMPFDSNSFDCALGTEVLEHCQYPEIVLKEVFRVLKPGGIFFFTVPFLWPLHEPPHDEYRYTPFAMKRIFELSGFANIRIYSTGGWNASLAQIMGLWVRRSALSEKKKYIYSVILKPIIKYLIAKDQKPTDFYGGQMITGLYGTTSKL